MKRSIDLDLIALHTIASWSTFSGNGFRFVCGLFMLNKRDEKKNGLKLIAALRENENKH